MRGVLQMPMCVVCGSGEIGTADGRLLHQAPPAQGVEAQAESCGVWFLLQATPACTSHHPTVAHSHSFLQVPQTWIWARASDTYLVTFQGPFSRSVTLLGSGAESKLELWGHRLIPDCLYCFFFFFQGNDKMSSNIKSTPTFFPFLLSFCCCCCCFSLPCFCSLVCVFYFYFMIFTETEVSSLRWALLVPTAGPLPSPACQWHRPWKAVAVFFLYLGAPTVAQWPVIPWSLSPALRAPGISVMPWHSYEVTQTNTTPSWGWKLTFSHCFDSPRNMFPGPFEWVSINSPMAALGSWELLWGCDADGFDHHREEARLPPHRCSR